jgi:ssDNA-binding Zn-finger/Zn-ribbon topoisomerase 1
MGITLHPTLGINPHMTVCRRCGGPAEELMLIGNRTSIYRCGNRDCGITIYGHRMSEPCPKCHDRGPHEKIGEVGEHDKLPATEPCDKCKAELAEHKQIVADGGIYFKCAQCGKSGVIKNTAPLCAMVREKMGVPAPKPCGVEFDKCEEHGG